MPHCRCGRGVRSWADGRFAARGLGQPRCECAERHDAYARSDERSHTPTRMQVRARPASQVNPTGSVSVRAACHERHLFTMRVRCEGERGEQMQNAHLAAVIGLRSALPTSRDSGAVSY